MNHAICLLFALLSLKSVISAIWPSARFGDNLPTGESVNQSCGFRSKKSRSFRAFVSMTTFRWSSSAKGIGKWNSFSINRHTYALPTTWWRPDGGLVGIQRLDVMSSYQKLPTSDYVIVIPKMTFWLSKQPFFTIRIWHSTVFTEYHSETKF